MSLSLSLPLSLSLSLSLSLFSSIARTRTHLQPHSHCLSRCFQRSTGLHAAPAHAAPHHERGVLGTEPRAHDGIVRTLSHMQVSLGNKGGGGRVCVR